jgi:hypothetical protein
MNKDELRDIMNKFTRAQKIVEQFNAGQAVWKTHEPANPDDPDIVITTAILGALKLMSYIDKLEDDIRILKAEFEAISTAFDADQAHIRSMAYRDGLRYKSRNTYGKEKK